MCITRPWNRRRTVGRKANGLLWTAGCRFKALAGVRIPLPSIFLLRQNNRHCLKKIPIMRFPHRGVSLLIIRRAPRYFYRIREKDFQTSVQDISTDRERERTRAKSWRKNQTWFINFFSTIWRLLLLSLPAPFGPTKVIDSKRTNRGYFCAVNLMRVRRRLSDLIISWQAFFIKCGFKIVPINVISRHNRFLQGCWYERYLTSSF